MESSLYILYHELNKKDFKIGKHSGSCGKLMSRYGTHSSGRYTLVAFFPGFGHLESCIHSHLKTFRLIKEETKKYSEWFRCDIYTILNVVSFFVKNDMSFKDEIVDLNKKPTVQDEKIDDEKIEEMKPELQALIQKYNNDLKNLSEKKKEVITEDVIPKGYALKEDDYEVKSKFFVKKDEVEQISESNQKFKNHVAKFKRVTKPVVLDSNLPREPEVIGLSESEMSKLKVSEPKVSELRSSEPKVSELRSSEPKVSELRSSEPKVSELRSSEPKVSELRSSEPKVSELRSSESKVSELRSNESRSNESRSNVSRSNESRSNVSRSNESRSNVSRSNESRSSEPNMSGQNMSKTIKNEIKQNEKKPIKSVFAPKSPTIDEIAEDETILIPIIDKSKLTGISKLDSFKYKKRTETVNTKWLNE